MAKPVLTTLTLPAGTSTRAPLVFPSGTLLGTATAGAEEYDGNFHYLTPDSASGRACIPARQVHYAAVGTAVGPTTVDFFASGSSIELAADSLYEIEYVCRFTKATAGTLNWILLASGSNPPLWIHGFLTGCPAGGLTTAGAPITSSIGVSSAQSVQFAATPSLTATQHLHRISAWVRTSTAAFNFRLRVAQSAGTIQRLSDSYYTVTRVSPTTGTFAT